MVECPACGHANAEGAKFCNECGSQLSAPPPAGREQRKIVTVLFCDVTGSTELGERLDPEALRTLLARYFERMKAIVERHGGTVEKFIGDAVMAVFGVPVVHEDDALRALRAAVEMRGAFPELGVQGRIGVTTGEVVTGTKERLATGDAVNVAARLEQAAQPGEILIGDETLSLTRDAAEVQAVRPLSLRGKSEPIVAHRLVGVSGREGVARRVEGTMVGRGREQRLLASAWERVVSEQTCQLFTILGPAGVGKSRLSAEFLAARTDATVVRGRCLPYGEGITYWPVVDVVKQLEAAEPDAAETGAIRALVSEEVVTSSEEIAWSFRRLLESAASARAVVCVFDDLQWGEETFLDLVEHVADLSRDAPILLLCMARPELLDRRPGWAGGKVNAASVLLEPLDASETDALIENLADLDEGLRARIREAAEGNPLFVEQMVAMARESPNGDVAVPPTIQALLAARLDQLDAAEREVLQCGAVEGRVFHRGAVAVLAADESTVPTRLTALVRKELVRPDRPQLPGDDAFRFRHLLIRDTAYDALPKAARAELHERFADWLEASGTSLVELDEILAYHLEQASRYRRELGAEDGEVAALAERAAGRLDAAGQRAFRRSDIPAAINLLERSASMLAADDARRIRVLTALGRALIKGGDLQGADAVLSEAVERGSALGDEPAAADAQTSLLYVRLHTRPEMTHEHVRPALTESIAVLEACHDHAALARAVELSASLLFWAGKADAALAELEQALALVRKTDDRSQELEIVRSSLAVAAHGSEPVDVAIRRMEDAAGLAARSSSLGVGALRLRAELEAMRGDIDAARTSIAEARSLAEELGMATFVASGIRASAGEIELMAGDAAAAEHELRASVDALEQMGNWGHLVTVLPYLTDALLQLGRGDEVLAKIEQALPLVVRDDADGQVGLRRVHARLLAERGQLEDAEREGREAVDRASGTDFLNLRGRALLDLASVLEAAGKADEATEALEQALALYERKGNLVMAARVRERL